MRITEKECSMLAFQHKDTPWVPSPSVGWNICIPSAVKEGAQGYGYTTDWFGVRYLYREDQPGPMPDEEHIFIKDIEQWKDIVKMPDIDAVDWEECVARDTAMWDRENNMTNVMMINGCFESLHMFCGFEGALCNIMTDEELCSDFMSWIADYKVALIERIAKYYKPDMITFHDDYATGSNLFMPIDKWRRIVRPHLKRCVDAVKGLGMIYQHHSCGMIRDLIPELLDIGIEALNPMQAQNDPVEMKRLYADELTICGGFDNINVLDNADASPEQIKDSVTKTLHEMAPGGNWIAMCTFLDRFPEREQIWLDALDEYNRPLYERQGIPFVKHNSPLVRKNIYNIKK